MGQDSAPGSAAPGYEPGGGTTGAIEMVWAQPDDATFCIFPLSLLDLVPDDFSIEPLGRAYKEQGLDEAAFAVSYPRPKRGRPRKK